MLSEEFYQDDEVGRPLELFAPAVKVESLNPSLRILIPTGGASLARGLLTDMQ